MVKSYIKVSLIVASIAIVAFLFWTISRAFSNAYETNYKFENNVNAQDYNKVPLNNIIYKEYEGIFELPINGATGYASINMSLYEGENTSVVMRSINAGEGFTILNEVGSFWQIKIDNQVGYVLSEYCFINLPDIIPSIIYKNTNSSSSIMKSSGKTIDNVTDQKLYNALFYNERLNREEYVMPVLYNTAKKISLAQKEALKNNETLVIYESYRPYSTQKQIVNNLTALANIDTVVYNGLNSSPWSTTWFISTKVSNHQKGLAIDASLAKINSTEDYIIGSYKTKLITSYTEYEMPSAMHELSSKSARFTTPVYSHSKTAWKNAKFTNAMENSYGAQKLQTYCTDSGLTPLASEWWHYNDLDSLNSKNGKGNFLIQNVYSIIPE